MSIIAEEWEVGKMGNKKTGVLPVIKVDPGLSTSPN
jgi:hypothetical protein